MGSCKPDHHSGGSILSMQGAPLSCTGGQADGSCPEANAPQASNKTANKNIRLGSVITLPFVSAE